MKLTKYDINETQVRLANTKRFKKNLIVFDFHFKNNKTNFYNIYLLRKYNGKHNNKYENTDKFRMGRWKYGIVSIWDERRIIGHDFKYSIGFEFIPPHVFNKHSFSEVFSEILNVLNNIYLENNMLSKEKLDVLKKEFMEDNISNEKEFNWMLTYNSLKKSNLHYLSKRIHAYKNASIKKISNESVTDFYHNIFFKQNLRVTAIGDIDEELLTKELKTFTKNIKRTKKSFNTRISQKEGSNKIVVDKSNHNSSGFRLILNIRNRTKDDYELLKVYNLILGGDTQSKLFRKIRTENSLAYDVKTYFYNRENHIWGTGEINVGSEELTETLILESIKEMGNNITDEELKYAINKFINITDNYSNTAESIYYNFNTLYYENKIEDTHEKYKKITKEDLYNLHKNISLNILYVLKGKNDGKN